MERSYWTASSGSSILHRRRGRGTIGFYLGEAGHAQFELVGLERVVVVIVAGVAGRRVGRARRIVVGRLGLFDGRRRRRVAAGAGQRRRRVRVVLVDVEAVRRRGLFRTVPIRAGRLVCLFVVVFFFNLVSCRNIFRVVLTRILRIFDTDRFQAFRFGSLGRPASYKVDAFHIFHFFGNLQQLPRSLPIGITQKRFFLCGFFEFSLRIDFKNFSWAFGLISVLQGGRIFRTFSISFRKFLTPTFRIPSHFDHSESIPYQYEFI